jgi:hypothetical protein
VKELCKYCLKGGSCESCIKDYNQLKLSEKKFNDEAIGKTCAGCNRKIKNNNEGHVLVTRDFNDKNWDKKKQVWIEAYRYYHSDKCHRLEFENSCKGESP